MVELSDYLSAAAARPFVWGECDCALFGADWVLARRGFDPAAGFRGTYRRSCQAQDVLILNRGLLALVTRQLAANGVEETDDPQPGDVGVVEATEGATVAIRVDGGWACKSPRGVIVAPRRIYKAWRI